MRHHIKEDIYCLIRLIQKMSVQSTMPQFYPVSGILMKSTEKIIQGTHSTKTNQGCEIMLYAQNYQHLSQHSENIHRIHTLFVCP